MSSLADVPTFERWTPQAILYERANTLLLEAIDPAGNRAVLKCYRGTEDAIGRLRFERERRLAKTIRHPHFLPLLDEGLDWLAFEMLDQNLRTRGALCSLPETASLLTRLAAAVGYLHARGIVHRDLKPGHIFLRRDKTPVIVDLGAAGLLASDPIDSVEAIGSPAWMAPEQRHGARPAPSADVYSLARIGQWLLMQSGLEVDESDALAFQLSSLIGRGLDPLPSARPDISEFRTLCVR